MDFVCGPAQTSSQQSKAHGFETTGEILLYPHADFFVFAFFGPPVYWPAKRYYLDVDKAGCCHVVCGFSTGVEGEAEGVCCFYEGAGPAVKSVGQCETVIVTAYGKVNVLDLNPATGFEVSRIC